MDFLAYAMTGNGGGAGSTGGAGGFTAFLPLILMFAIFYFLLIRPQQKKAKAHKQLLSSISKGDKIVSGGGLYGIVTGVAEDAVTVEIAPKVRVKIARGSISAVVGKGVPEKQEKTEKEK